jgi:hypothetical protein
LLVKDFEQPVTTDWARAIPDAVEQEDLRRCFAGRPEERFGSARDVMKGLWAEAIQDSETAVAIEGGPASLGALCCTYARARRTADARQVLERLEQMTTKRIVPPTAMTHSGCMIYIWSSE